MAPCLQALTHEGSSQCAQGNASECRRMPGNVPVSLSYTVIHFSAPGSIPFQSLHAMLHAWQA